MIKMYDPQIYPSKLWIAVDMTQEEIEKFEELSEFDKEQSYAMVDNVRQKEPLLGGLLIRFATVENINFENVVHETLHTALDIFDYCDCKIDANNQEPFAYLCGWVGKCCEDFKNECLKSKSE